MDVSMLIEVHQYYINNLKQKIRDNEKKNTPPTIVVSAPKITDNRACVPAKIVTLEIERVSCMHGCVEIYDSNGTNIASTAREPVCAKDRRRTTTLHEHEGLESDNNGLYEHVHVRIDTRNGSTGFLSHLHLYRTEQCSGC